MISISFRPAPIIRKQLPPVREITSAGEKALYLAAVKNQSKPTANSAICQGIMDFVKYFRIFIKK